MKLVNLLQDVQDTLEDCVCDSAPDFLHDTVWLARNLNKAIKHLDIGECEIDKNVLYVSNHHPWRCDRHFVSWAT